MLHYSLNKNHAYVDGNKRLALAAMLSFLYLNDFLLMASDAELEVLALGIADDSLSRQDTVQFVTSRAMRLSWSYDRAERWLNRRTASDHIALTAILRSGQLRVTAPFVQASRDELLKMVRRPADTT